ncbi:zinc finger MYM-type protein 1-like, partial [Tachysurus ichikawai]
MDGTQDLSGKEQESVCLRYVDHDLIVHEEFVGMYEVSVTTGENLAKVLKDVLLRRNLSITGLRGQAYDGAANLAGKYSGAQAIIKESQPLALYVHCGPHCVNLITQHACTSSPVIRDSLQWVHEVGGLFHQSVKMKSILQDISKSESGSITAIRPLCPTRWTVRTSAIRAVLKQYQPMLLALEEMSSGHSVSLQGKWFV